MSKNVAGMSRVNFPSTSPMHNFSFQAVDEAGVFRFHFRYFNDRWNCWVTTPSGEKRQAGVYPNTISWLGFLDFGIVFITEMKEISFNELFSTELYIVKWQ